MFGKGPAESCWLWMRLAASFLLEIKSGDESFVDDDDEEEEEFDDEDEEEEEGYEFVPSSISASGGGVSGVSVVELIDRICLAAAAAGANGSEPSASSSSLELSLGNVLELVNAFYDQPINGGEAEKRLSAARCLRLLCSRCLSSSSDTSEAERAKAVATATGEGNKERRRRRW